MINYEDICQLLNDDIIQKHKIELEKQTRYVLQFSHMKYNIPVFIILSDEFPVGEVSLTLGIC